MTTLETLAKYGLKTNVKAIKERILKLLLLHDVDEDVVWYNVELTGKQANEVQNIILLLCSLAEKGERYEKAVKEKVESAIYTLENVDDDIEERNYYTGRKEMAEELLDEIITEAEGETK